MGVRNRRRKEERPQEIVDAALKEFAINGYAATRLDDVARRAGISKGTIYLYFGSKEELFKAVVRKSVVPQLERVEDLLAAFDGTAEALIRLQITTLQRAILETEVRDIVRLIIAEAATFPDLAEFYFHEVIERGKGILGRTIAFGVARGEFRDTGLAAFPQLLVAPVVMALIWKTLFERHDPLDLDGLIETHLDLLLNGLGKERS
ncbi:MAG TPA: TetR/AcrR family transcriptional regulator [Alphaproteobacteria bacterium]|nr:TetR/AcrR family transcriptional regulator [Alphaproteobacteria bacterium]